MADYTCDQVIDEIFQKLPPKSLFRFRSLSKAWCSRIDSPDFIQKHGFSKNLQRVLIKHRVHCQQRTTGELYTLHSENQLPLTTEYKGIAPLEFPINDFRIIGSCNGILCVFDVNKRITLWNPSIRRKLTLEAEHPYQILNDFERAQIYGFGFDPTTNDYKIVRISISRFRDALVYTVNTGTWCAIPSSNTIRFSEVKSSPCFVNGALHWVVANGSFCFILAFDLSTHGFGMIPLPEPGLETTQLAIINGSLAVVSCSLNGDNSWVWVQKKYEGLMYWDLFLKSNGYPYEGRIERVLQLTSNDNFVFYTCREGYKVYNPVTGERTKLEKFKVHPDEDNNIKTDIVDIISYVESFELLDKGIAY